jgi:hypothetical protein
MVNAVRTDISYMAVAPDELAKQLDGRSVVFYVPGIAKQVKPILKSAWSEIAFQRTFYSQDGSPILKSAANFAVNYGPPAGTGAALRDSYLRPGLWLVLAVVVFLVLTACFRETWLERASNWAKRTYHRITAEAEME